MVKLIENYYMDADENQYILKRKVSYKKSDGSDAEREETKGYFSSVENLIVALANKLLRERIQNNEIKDLFLCVEELRDIKSALTALVNVFW